MKVGKFSYWKVDPASVNYQITGSKEWPDWPVNAPDELVQETQCFVNPEEPDVVIFLPWDKPELGRWASYGSVLKRYPSTHREERVDAEKWFTLRRGSEVLEKESMVDWARRTGNRLIESDQLTGVMEVRKGSRWSKDFRTTMPSDFNPGGRGSNISKRGKRRRQQMNDKLTEKLQSLLGRVKK